MKTSITYREILLIAYPIIIGSVAQNLLNITDTAFLGRVGPIALGAGAIGGVFYLVAAMLAWGFGIGTQIIIARRKGERAYGEIADAAMRVTPKGPLTQTVPSGATETAENPILR